MTKRTFFILVTLANLALLAGAYYYFDRLKPRPVQAEAAQSEPAPAVAVQSPAPEPVAPPPPAIIVQTNDFHWRQLESSDYRTYIANLRAVGCPENTIKDIILTDIMKLFAERRGRFYQNGREFKYWETSEKRALSARQIEDREKEMSKIDKEMPAILRDLLGVNYDREINKYFVDNHEDDRRLSFVSEDKRKQLLALRDEIEGLKERIVDQAQKGQPMDVEGLKKIQEHQDQILSQILTPAEREEYALRTSDTADRLRNQLVGFNPTEQEFRDIYKLWQAHDEKFAYVSADDETARRAKEEDQKRVEEEVRAKLSPDRLADYERTRSADYQNLYLFAERYELPQSTVQAVMEIRQVAENARQNLLAQSSIADAERQAALKAVQEETRRALRQNLGDKIFAAYTSNGGGWMNSLGASASTH